MDKHRYASRGMHCEDCHFFDVGLGPRAGRCRHPENPTPDAACYPSDGCQGWEKKEEKQDEKPTRG